ncbi:MAG: hypothetical protein ACR5K7_06185 [Symbiopectobacterium sp.]
MFSERLQDIPQMQTCVILTWETPTACYQCADEFLAQTQQILDLSIQVINSEEEARLIYRRNGITLPQEQRLVVDIPAIDSI